MPRSLPLTLQLGSPGAGQKRPRDAFGAVTIGPMRRRSRSFPKRLLRRGFSRWIQSNIKALVALTLGFCLLLTFVTWIQRTAYARGLVEGALITTYVGTVLLSYLMTSGAINHLGGAW